MLGMMLGNVCSANFTPKQETARTGGFAGKNIGGSDGARTRDLRRDRPALWTKLSYAPVA